MLHFEVHIMLPVADPILTSLIMLMVCFFESWVFFLLRRIDTCRNR